METYDHYGAPLFRVIHHDLATVPEGAIVVGVGINDEYRYPVIEAVDPGYRHDPDHGWLYHVDSLEPLNDDARALAAIAQASK